MKLFIKKHQLLPTEGGMGGGADKPIDGWANVRMDRQTDRQMGIGTNMDGPTDPPIVIG